METPLVVGDRRFPSGNPNGIMTVGMDVDQFPHPETPEDGPSPFPLPEFEGRALPHPPPGILKGFCHKARGCAVVGVTPGMVGKCVTTPKVVVPNGRTEGMWGLDIV